MENVINRLYEGQHLDDAALLRLITLPDGSEDERYLFTKADARKKEIYQNKVFIRGLIELSNYCKNNCLYCGIRAANKDISRYRLNEEQVLDCAKHGYELGFRTFVLQGGEDPAYSDKDICNMVGSIKELFPDCAVTLSIGEKSYESYKAYKQAGADRYLLRHETATKEHYKQLHPETMSFENRLRCLQDLKALGYQVGSGFMVGSPYQTPLHLVADLRFLQKLQPDMIGIGPFIPHHQTPFAKEKQGDLHLTLRMLAILRLMFPKALLPSTTALGSIDPDGRTMGLQCGANVVMPNLSPLNVRELYKIYDNKAYINAEAAEGLSILKAQAASIGCQVVIDRGDAKR